MKRYNYLINGQQFVVEILSFDGRTASVRVNDADYDVQVEDTAPSMIAPAAPRTAAPVPPPPTTPPPASPTPPPAPRQSAPPPASANAVLAPMPGIILKVLVSEGQSVAAGETVVVLEAMKMENEIHASRAGTVQRIRVRDGDEVRANEVLIELE